MKHLFSCLLFLVLLQFTRGQGNFYQLTVDSDIGVDDLSTCHVEYPIADFMLINSSVPCRSIGFALTGIQEDDTLELTVNPGVYSGANNINLQLNILSFQIFGTPDGDGTLPTVDCGNANIGATITPKSLATIDQMKWRRCTSARGGALNVAADSVTDNRLIITKSAFESNSASESGGAIYSAAAVLSVSESLFTGNSATPPSITDTASGGAISVLNKQISVTRSTFIGNSATQGGAIYGFNLGGNALITNSNFTNNMAKTQGGAFFSETSGSTSLSFFGTVFSENCATDSYSDSTGVQVRCTPAATCNIAVPGNFSGCLDVYVPPPPVNRTDDGKRISSKDRTIIIGVVVPFGVIFIVSIALFLFLRKKTNTEMEKRELYRKQILKALERMSPEEQEAARQEAERADPKAPKCQLCMTRPINNPLPCGHAVVCSVCRTILLECPVKGCKQTTR